MAWQNAVRNAGLGVIALAVAGCHRDARTDEQRQASGEVLQGSISDGMIPYESLKSHPPLAPRVVGKAAGDSAGAEDAASGDGDAPQDAAPAPSASAAATPSIAY